MTKLAEIFPDADFVYIDDEGELERATYFTFRPVADGNYVTTTEIQHRHTNLIQIRMGHKHAPSELIATYDAEDLPSACAAFFGLIQFSGYLFYDGIELSARVESAEDMIRQLCKNGSRMGDEDDEVYLSGLLAAVGFGSGMESAHSFDASDV